MEDEVRRLDEGRVEHYDGGKNLIEIGRKGTDIR